MFYLVFSRQYFLYYLSRLIWAITLYYCVLPRFLLFIFFTFCLSSCDNLCEETSSEVSNVSDGNSTSDISPKKKRRRKWHQKSNSQSSRSESPPINRRRIRLSQQNYAAMSADSSDGHRFGRLRRSCGILSGEGEGEDEFLQRDENITDVDRNIDNLNVSDVDPGLHTDKQHQSDSEKIVKQGTVQTKSSSNHSSETTNSVDIPNAQAEKYNQIPHSQSSNPETEDTYVDYRVTHVQGGGDKPELQTSVDGAYSLVANSLRLSTV